MPKTQFLIDLFPSIVSAFDFRKLRGSYSGNAIRVLRTSDNTEQDFPFVANEVVGADVLSFCGAFGSLSKGYNQTSGGDDVINATIIRQPIIVNSSALITDGGKLALQGGSTLGLRSTSTVALSGYTDLFFTFGVNVNDVLTAQQLFETSSNFNSNNGAMLVYIQAGILYVSQRRTSATPSTFMVKSYSISTGRQLITVRFRTGQTATNASQVWINGIEVTGTVVLNNSTITLSNQIIYLFSRNANSIGFLGKYQNFTMFTDSTQRTGIENNINDYYGYY
jgi:hypothetical protein